MQDFQGFARMLRGSSGIKEFAFSLQKPAGASSSDTKVVRKQVFMSGNDITPFT